MFPHSMCRTIFIWKNLNIFNTLISHHIIALEIDLKLHQFYEGVQADVSLDQHIISEYQPSK